jgi:hypothetical protein
LIPLEGKLLFSERSIVLASIGRFQFTQNPVQVFGVTGNTRISIGAYRVKSQQIMPAMLPKM